VGVPGVAEETTTANVSEAPSEAGSAEEFTLMIVAGSEEACTVVLRLEALVAKLLSPL
jgi:hypothetical protein